MEQFTSKLSFEVVDENSVIRKVIDVSSCNGLIDWNRVKGNVDGVIIRCAFGNDCTSQDDKQFKRNLSECERLGIPVAGVYIYSYALTIEEAHSEAAHVLRLLNGKKVPVFIDMEDADNYKRNHGLNPYANRQLLTNIAITFLKDMQVAGFTAKQSGVYANYDWFKNCLDYQTLKEYGLIWLAQWCQNKSIDNVKCWQYSSNGTVPGINGRVDMNLWYGSWISFEPEIEIKKEISCDHLAEIEKLKEVKQEIEEILKNLEK